MSSSSASSRIESALPLLVLMGAFLGMLPLEQRLNFSAARPDGFAAAGDVLGPMGGMRAVVAGGFWLRANLAWEQRDAAATVGFLKLTVAADHEPLYFWLNGARMIAYDLPVWRFTPGMPGPVRRQVRVEQASAALDFLTDGLRAHPGDAELLIEMASIRLRVLGDREAAAGLFRQAAAQPGAPYYAARIHAELLTQLGRPAEALAWLKQLLPTLPADNPAADRAVVVQRIKALEAQLVAP